MTEMLAYEPTGQWFYILIVQDKIDICNYNNGIVQPLKKIWEIL